MPDHQNASSIVLLCNSLSTDVDLCWSNLETTAKNRLIPVWARLRVKPPRSSLALEQAESAAESEAAKSGIPSSHPWPTNSVD
eukprot:2038141-Amphidinium_carterae.1